MFSWDFINSLYKKLTKILNVVIIKKYIMSSVYNVRQDGAV